MLSALIFNLQLFRDRGRTAAGREQDREVQQSLPLSVQTLSPSTDRVWLEAGDGCFSLQLFCPEWKTSQSMNVALTAFGQREVVQIAAGTPTREAASTLALALDRWFDVTLPTTQTESQRSSLVLRTKTRAGAAASSTDGMVLVRCDGRGFDVEVGLDEPVAAGGVITVAVGGSLARITTASGQHGSSVALALAARLDALGCVVERREERCDETFRVRLELLAVNDAFASRATA